MCSRSVAGLSAVAQQARSQPLRPLAIGRVRTEPSMPKGPRGEKRPGDVIGAAIVVVNCAKP
jgi:hypothetical protein